MDEWSDESGRTLPPGNPVSFQFAMGQAFYGPLGEYTVPEEQRHFATADMLPTYAEKIAALKADGAKLITVFGIGRMMHIVSAIRLYHWRLRRCAVKRHAVARDVSVDDIAPWIESLVAINLYAYSARQAIFLEGTCWPS